MIRQEFIELARRGALIQWDESHLVEYLYLSNDGDTCTRGILDRRGKLLKYSKGLKFRILNPIELVQVKNLLPLDSSLRQGL